MGEVPTLIRSERVVRFLPTKVYCKLLKFDLDQMNVEFLVCVGAFVCFGVYYNVIGLGVCVNVLLLTWCTDILYCFKYLNCLVLISDSI